VLTVPLGAEALKPVAADATQVITITGQLGPRALPQPASMHAISNTDLQNLSTVLANDPLRAVQNLPGVTANQDFYGQFAVRGASPSHVGVVIDGVLLDNAFHGFTDKGDLGSVSILNGALVDSTALYSGVAPARFGGRTGAAVQVETRAGSRDASYTRLDVDLLSASLTREGAIGSDQRGSYLVSARKSYLQYLTSKLANGSSSLGYSDVDLKVDYDLNPGNRLSLTTLLGSSTLSREAQVGNPQAGIDRSGEFMTDGSGRQDFSTLRWMSQLGPRTTSQAQAFWTSDRQTQRNANGVQLLKNDSTQTGLKEVLAHELADGQKLEAGFSVARRQTRLQESSIWNYSAGTLSSTPAPVADFARSSLETGAHVQDTIGLMDERLQLKLGARWDRSGATGQSVFLPRVDASYALRPGTQVALALGQSAQFASPDQLYGKFGTPGLRAERATTAALSLDQDLGNRWRLHTEVYERRESQLIGSPLTQFRLTGSGAYAIPTLGAVLNNSLSGHARGVELMVQRESANGFSGWLSLSRSLSRYTPGDGSAAYWGDNDQRTAVTAYGSYRWSDSLSVSANARYGSGTPVAAYLGAASTSAGRGGETLLAYSLAASPNGQRAGAYQRLDLRINKVIHGQGYKLTLKAEIANLLGHENWRYYDTAYPAPGAAQTVLVTRNTTMPRLPTVGMSLEF
jgi:outer membrane cobalamin receptor